MVIDLENVTKEVNVQDLVGVVSLKIRGVTRPNPRRNWDRPTPRTGPKTNFFHQFSIRPLVMGFLGLMTLSRTYEEDKFLPYWFISKISILRPYFHFEKQVFIIIISLFVFNLKKPRRSSREIHFLLRRTEWFNI